MSELRAHGANPEKLYAAMGVEMPDEVYDFSTNASVVDWEWNLKISLPDILSRYPDDESSELRSLIACREGCKPGNVLVTNGSNEAIYILASLTSCGLNRIVQPVYGEYLTALRAWCAETENIRSLNGIDGSERAVWLCNPCNPTGSWIPDRELASAIERHPKTLFIVDEAYIDFLNTEREGLPAHKFANLVVLRSLTKIYHLCGARIGYAVADDRLITAIKERQPTWSVNGVAQAAALAFLKDADFLKRSKSFYAAETPRFIENIRRTGFKVRPTSVNFFLIETDNDTTLIKFLLKKGIAVRHTRNFPGLDGRCIRVATRLPQENDTLVAALKEFKG